MFFLLSVLVWNVNCGALGQGKPTKCFFSLIFDFPLRCSKIVVLKVRPLVVIDKDIFL